MAMTLLLMALIAIVAAAVGWLVSRQRVSAPTAARNEPPTSLDRSDFRSPDAAWLIAVFTSANCSSCAAVVDELKAYDSSDIIVVEVEVGAEPALHRKYAIDSVPTTVVAAGDGDARLGILGPLGPDHREVLRRVLAADR